MKDKRQKIRGGDSFSKCKKRGKMEKREENVKKRKNVKKRGKM
jgi:hypothetical protein